MVERKIYRRLKNYKRIYESEVVKNIRQFLTIAYKLNGQAQTSEILIWFASLLPEGSNYISKGMHMGDKRLAGYVLRTAGFTLIPYWSKDLRRTHKVWKHRGHFDLDYAVLKVLTDLEPKVFAAKDDKAFSLDNLI